MYHKQKKLPQYLLLTSLMKIFELEINNLRIQILAGKMTSFRLKFYLSWAPSPYRFNFSVQFSVQYINIIIIIKINDILGDKYSLQGFCFIDQKYGSTS